MERPVGLALLGCGTVGTGLLRALGLPGTRSYRWSGLEVELLHILVRDTTKQRPPYVPRDLITSDPETALTDPRVDVVVEVMGGSDDAYRHVRRALEAGKHVVTANKEIMARYGSELLSLAEERAVELRYEASVGGGIPIVRLLGEDLAANHIHSIEAVINGTTNYILSRMATENWSMDRALAQAQALGYAEPDPSNDIQGHDAAYKLSILVRLAFGLEASPEQIYREGIDGLSLDDFRLAARLGYTVKLVAVARRSDRGVLAGVHPALVARSHPLAQVNDVFNGLRIEGDLVGSLFICGRGAGPEPTASALMADILAVARTVADEKARPWPCRRRAELGMAPFAEADYRYLIRLSSPDAPDVQGRVAGVLTRFGIPTSSILGEPNQQGLQLTILTGRNLEGRHRAALESLARLEGVKVERALRVIE